MSTSTRPTSTPSILETPYTLDSITRASSPIANDTRDWHTYVIAHGDNKIVGHRPGSAEHVRRAAEDLVLRLNERRSFYGGRKHLMLASGDKT